MANWKEKLENIEIEQHPPNKPSFLKVVLLSGAAIIVIFVIAYFVLEWSNSGIVPKHHYKSPTSQLIEPAPLPGIGPLEAQG